MSPASTKVQDKLRRYITELLSTLKMQCGRGRAVTHVNFEHYSAFVSSCFEAMPTDPLARLYLVDMFVQEVYTQDVTCLLHDSLLRELDEASDGVPGTFVLLQHACGLLVRRGV